MSIEHHPPETIIASFAAGTLDNGQHVAIATHLTACAHCRSLMRSMEQVGGAVLADLPPASMSGNGLAAIEARLDDAAAPRAPAAPPADNVTAGEIPGLPRFVRRYRFGAWTLVAPRVRVRQIVLPDPGDTRVFLLKAGSGTRLLEHAHTGLEMTCVLDGSFTQAGSRYAPGDFDFGDDTIDHQATVEQGRDCICLVAMQGELRLKGLIGRLVQPFVKL
jgi:putative transcriptional regulator